MNTIIDDDNFITFLIHEDDHEEGRVLIEFMRKDGASVNLNVTLEGVMKVMSNFVRSEKNLQGRIVISVGDEVQTEIKGAILMDALLEAKAKLESLSQ